MKIGKKLLKLIQKKSLDFEIKYSPFWEWVGDKIYYSGGGVVTITIEYYHRNFIFADLLFDDNYKIVKNDDYQRFIDKVEKLPNIEKVAKD